jgi:hypothetical protein
MDSTFHGTIFFVWMLMSSTLGTCASHKLGAWKLLDFMNEPSMGCSLVPLLWFIASRKKPVARLF